MYITHCPRCGAGALEHSTTHAYCWECSYAPAPEPSMFNWMRIEFPRRKSPPEHTQWFERPGNMSQTRFL